MSKFDRPTSAKGNILLDRSMGDTQSKFNSTSVIKLKKNKNKKSSNTKQINASSNKHRRKIWSSKNSVSQPQTK